MSTTRTTTRTAHRASTGPRYALVVDTTKCIGCEACSVACRAENDVPEGHWRSRIVPLTIGPGPGSSTASQVPVKWSCMHCAEAPCVQVCPTKATYQRPDGIVVMDADRCVGCKYCIVACPYGARYFDEEKGLPDKCDLCVDRLDAGLQPACVQTCVGRALAVADLNDPDDEAAARIRSGEARPLHPELGTEPAVYYVMEG